MKRKRWLRLLDAVKIGAVCVAALYMVSSISAVADEATEKSIIQMETIKVMTLPVENVTQEPVLVAMAVEPMTLEYPFNTMSADWDGDQLNGFREFSMPEEYAQSGGYLPLLVQQYAWCVCQSYDADYAMILALIEVESGYRNETVGSSGEVGYMQVIEKWHRDRMERLGVDDLANPYMNILTGVDYIAELTSQYQDAHLALSIYNRGFRNDKGTGALDLWERGESSTEYSASVLNRAKEIREELSSCAEG